MRKPTLQELNEWAPLALLGVVTGVVAWCYAHVFAGEPCGDDNTHHFAEIARLAEAMRHGDWNWWNPNANAGYASGYYYQVLPQAVPAALSALTGLSILRCFQLGIFVPLLLAPAAAYRAMRILGASKWAALGAAVAVPFAISGHLMGQGNNDAARWGAGADGTFWVGLYTQLWAFAAFPLALAHGARWIDEQESLAPAIAWSIFVGLCHPFAGVALGLALTVGTLWFSMWALIGKQRGQVWQPLVRLVVLGALMVLGAACAWLPVLVDYKGFGGFPYRVADEVGPGFKRLADWLIHGRMLDDGRIPVLSMLLPLVGAITSFEKTRWLPRLWTTAVAYLLLLAMGPNMPKTGGQDDLLPAVRFLGSLQVVLAMIAGGGVVVLVEWVWKQKIDASARMPVRIAAIAFAGACGMIVLLWGAGNQHARVRVAGDFEGIDRDDLINLMPAIAKQPPGRIQVRGGAGNHWAISLPYAYTGREAFLVMGGASLQSSPNYVYAWEFRDTDPERAAWIFDAPLVILRRDKAIEVHGEPVQIGNTYELQRFPAPGLVSPVQVIGVLPPGREAERKKAAEWLWSDDAMHERVLAHADSGEPGPPPHGQVLAYSRQDSSIHADLQVDDGDQPTTFMVRESWHPRWHALLDGHEVPIRRVSPDFMAVDVPAGTHTLDLHFERPLWNWLLWLLWPGLTIAAWQWSRVRRRIPDETERLREALA